jgi:SAM-dependent methyltransferase
MPLAGDFRLAGESNRLYPLAIDVCRNCGLLQVRELVPHDVVFSPTYSYSSSTIPGLVRHFERYAEEVSLPPGSTKRLLEIGCNDGVFLQPLASRGYRVVGIDACENVVERARCRGLDVRCGRFGKVAAESLREECGTFDVLTCSNVFAHNPELGDFLDGVMTLLDPRGGEFWVEVHSALGLYEGLQWDCFYHEHCYYWNIHSLAKCLEGRGLYLKRYRTTSMHGGAIRAAFSRERTGIVPPERSITTEEWLSFGKECIQSRELIQDSVETLPLTYAYGAAGRAVTLINWTGIASQLEFVVDGSPLRYGKAIPNTGIPIISEEEFGGRRPGGNWCFVTAHNYLNDIRRKVESYFPGRRVRFVTPLPHVAIR